MVVSFDACINDTYNVLCFAIYVAISTLMINLYSHLAEYSCSEWYRVQLGHRFQAWCASCRHETILARYRYHRERFQFCGNGAIDRGERRSQFVRADARIHSSILVPSAKFEVQAETADKPTRGSPKCLRSAF